MRRVGARMAVLGLAVVAAGGGAASAATPITWTHQFGSADHDQGRDAVTNAAGEVFIAGNTSGNLGGTPQGNGDVFVAKLDKNGNRVWTVLLGSSDYDWAGGLTFGPGGDLYIGGTTVGVLDAATDQAGDDAFVARISTKGVVKWAHQYGSASDDDAVDVVGTSSAVFLIGETAGVLAGETAVGGVNDNFAMKLDKNGVAVWTTQYGTVGGEEPQGATVTKAGQLVVAGNANNHFASPGLAAGGDQLGYVVGFSKQGDIAWVQEFDTPGVDSADDVAQASATELRVAGYTDGHLGIAWAGGTDAFVSAIGVNGGVLWTNQFGSSGQDLLYELVVAADGTTYAVGETTGSLTGFSGQGGSDGMAARLSKFGDVLTVRQFGTAGNDDFSDVVLGKGGRSIVVVGSTTSAVFGHTSAGNSDVVALAFAF